MTRIISILCVTAILSAIGQNRGDIWVMANADCPISPTILPLQCSSSIPACTEESESKAPETGCCASGCPSEEPAPTDMCGSEQFGGIGPIACPKPDEEQKCCKLIHPLWADIPTKAVAPTPDIESVAVFRSAIPFDIGRVAEIDQTNRPWGIHPSIASTVLRI